MSHYSVAVITPNSDREYIEHLLAPYSETDEEYFDFCKRYTNKEARAEYTKWRKDPKNKKELRKYRFDSWMKWYFGYDWSEEKQAWGYMANPNAKWDWYSIGGRWAGEFDQYLKHGTAVKEDGAYQVSDYVFSIDPEDKMEAEKFWDEYVLGQNPDAHSGAWFRPEYYLERYGTKEVYADHVSFAPRCYAFVTPDGEWHETGSMGWWGMDQTSAEAVQKYTKDWMGATSNPDYQNMYLVWIDCHI